MKAKYIEVSIHANGIEIYDHTHYVEMFENIAKAWEVIAMRKRFNFITVSGKEVTYNITGLQTYEKARQFAIWYHVNKASGNIRAYRLD